LCCYETLQVFSELGVPSRRYITIEGCEVFSQYFGQLNQEEISHDSGHRKMKITLIAAGTT